MIPETSYEDANFEAARITFSNVKLLFKNGGTPSESNVGKGERGIGEAGGGTGILLLLFKKRVPSK